MNDAVPVIIALDQGGLELARRMAPAIPGARLHGLAGRVEGADETFSQVAQHLGGLFTAGHPIIGICAAGILIRALGPLLSDKRKEPPVVAVSGDGKAAVPLLGGHRGANRLALQIAEHLSAFAAVTTAGDTRLGLALDDPPQGWRVANRINAKAVTAALLAGDAVALKVEAGNADWLSDSPVVWSDAADMAVRITEKEVAEPGQDLVLHPPVLALGVGCERGCDPAVLEGLVREKMAAAGLSLQAVAGVFSHELKSDEAAVLALANKLGVPARFFDADELEAETPRLANPSDIVYREVGSHGVSEAAALAAVGEAGRLILPKEKNRKATCAVAISPEPLVIADIGRGRGRLTVAGIGPGRAGWRTPDVTDAIAEATDVVGYGLYLDLLGDALKAKSRHETPMTTEEARARLALDLAAEGKRVVLVCSGDAGIYALATLVMELMDRENRPEWNRLEVEIAPGVSAIQAAAARIGAPINHDFCTISLSDLLTPWEDIERRLKGAALGDFVVAFYNPVSKRRRHQLEAARDILLSGRGPETPVVLARNLGRDEETLRVTTLGTLSADDADMLTLVLVGSSNSRVMERGGRQWVYTPRGYARKMKPVQG